jgi:hypothetical protein
VSATPSFVVNGVKLPSGAFLDAAIRFELERASRLLKNLRSQGQQSSS